MIINIIHQQEALAVDDLATSLWIMAVAVVLVAIPLVMAWGIIAASP
jgi:hypothetical protein